MQVLLLNGSPREKGCTHRALWEVASALEQAGIQTNIYHISNHTHGCLACGKCRQGGGCVYTDDSVREIAALLPSVDGIVVGSPVHYAGAAGALVATMDRLCYSAGQYLRRKPAAAVVSARRAGTTTALDELNRYFGILEMPVVSSSYWNMVHGSTPAEVEEDAEGLQVMRNLGRNMAWLLHCLEAGRAAGIMPPEGEYGARTNFIRGNKEV